ncbi:hypothetical protein J6590_069571 [Homalodisca vitripennis]|nr:hypothetical protein J6590_069571 [Homalodisca vitripennis]
MFRRSRRFRRSTTNTTSGAHGGIVQSRTEVDLILTDFDKDKREAIVSLPRKMLVKYTAGNDCQHQKSVETVEHTKWNVSIVVHPCSVPVLPTLVHLHTWHALLGLSFLSVAGMVVGKCWPVSLITTSEIGTHGYDPVFSTMRAFFMATGPMFKRNFKIDPFENINIYPLAAHMLGLPLPLIAPNGTLSTLQTSGSQTGGRAPLGGRGESPGGA